MKMLIGGEWVEGENDIEVRNPYDNSVVDTVPSGTREYVKQAIASCSRGFEKIRSLSSQERFKILHNCAVMLGNEKENFTITIAKESGKTKREAMAEVNRAIQTFLISAEETKRIHGETIPFDSAPGMKGKFGFYIRVPVGIIAAITPFNFPLNLVAHKVAPALGCGNSVLLKPATKTPLSALNLARLLLECGLPGESLNVVTGWGEDIGDAIVKDENVRMITFTGSLEVGKRIASSMGLKKMTMELGSNSSVVVMEDADIDKAVPRIVEGGYALAGQVCISVQRIFVQEKIFERFVALLVEKVKSLIVGDQLDDKTNVGPMISEGAARRACDWIEEAEKLGGQVLCGGNRNRSILEPTVLVNVPKNAKVCSEEAFAPIVVVNPFGNFEEALEKVNDSKYGLQAGIYTKNIKFALEAAKRLEVGGVMINEIPMFRADLMPYGGVKYSGFGREGPKFAMEEMTEIKTICIEI